MRMVVRGMQDNHRKPVQLAKRVWVIITLCAVLITLYVAVLFYPVPNWKPEISGPPIPYDHLSNEESEPYGNYGRPPVRREEIKAATQFPDALSCLVSSEQSKVLPDLRKINWVQINDKSRMDVCMFRIFASYGTPEKAVLWFDAQGLRTEGPDEVTFNSGLSIGVHGYNSPAEDKHVYVSNTLWGRWLLSRLVYVESFAASWDESGVLTNTSYMASSK